MDVLAENVELDVDDGARLEIVEVGDFVGVGDDGDGEMAFVGIHHRETHAVDGDGALRHGDVAALGVVGEVVTPAAVVIHHLFACGGLINVTLNDVISDAYG